MIKEDQKIIAKLQRKLAEEKAANLADRRQASALREELAAARKALKMGIDEILYLRKELGRPDKPESLIVASLEATLNQITPKP